MKKLLIFVLAACMSGCSTEIDGSSTVNWAQSVAKITKEHGEPQGQLSFMEALSRMIMLSYAMNNPDFNREQYQNMYKGLDAQEIMEKFASNPLVIDEVIKQTDGMNFSDVIKAGNDAHEKLTKLLSERPNILTSNEIVDEAVKATAPTGTVAENTAVLSVEDANTQSAEPSELKTALESDPVANPVQPEPQAVAVSSAVTSTPEQLELAKYKAKDAIDEANKQINVVWNATTKDIRKALLPEQKAWLKQREDDCSLKASNEEPSNLVVQETIKSNCMAEMTVKRTYVLQNEIYGMVGD